MRPMISDGYSGLLVVDDALSNLEWIDQLRAPERAREAVQRCFAQERELSRTAREGRFARAPQARGRGRRQRGPLRGDREGLRDLPRAVRRDHARRARGDRSEEDPRDRDPGLRGPRRHRSDLLRPPLLPGAGQGRREGLRPAGEGDERRQEGRRRPLRAEKPRAPCRDPSRGERADDGDDAIRRRGGLPRGRGRGRRPRGRPQAREARGRHGQAADRLAHVRLRPGEVPRRVPRGAPGPHRPQGAGPGRGRARLRGAQAHQDARPDGRARGEPRRGPRRAARRGRRGRRRQGKAQEALDRQEVRVPFEDLPVQVAIAKQGQSREVDVDGHQLELTNLDKVLWPETGFTKGEMIDYYARIADVILLHLRGRPLTLKRYPNGVAEGHFYEKRCPKHRPAWVNTAPIWSGRNEGEIDYCVCDDRATLIWVAQLASLELHPSLSRAKDIEQPTVLAFDLDPGAPAGMLQCCTVGLRLRELFDNLGLESFPKTSGSKGLQLNVPRNRK